MSNPPNTAGPQYAVGYPPPDASITMTAGDQVFELKPGEGAFLNGKRLLHEGDENTIIDMVKEVGPYMGLDIQSIDYSRSNKISNKEYWLKFGSCPICRSGEPAPCLNGSFSCNKCGWMLGK